MYQYKIKDSILKFKSLDTSSMSFEEIRNEIEKLFKNINYSFIPLTLRKGFKFHRIRINSNDKLFDNLSDLWSPPLNLTKLGRCNTSNEQILYMSGGGDTALRETSPRENDLVTCLECELQEDIIVANIGAIEKVQRELYFRQFKNLKDRYDNHIYKNKPKLKKIHKTLESLLVQEFTKNVEEENLHYYKKSAAISNFYLSAPTLQGIIYPSIRSNMQNLNYAFPALEAKKFLKPVRIDVFRMGYFKGVEKLGFKMLKGSYLDLDFNNAIIYTDEYRPIEKWANKV